MPQRIDFDWDPGKAASNVVKHQVTFEEAMTVIADPMTLSRRDVDSDPFEERWVTIGGSSAGRLLVVVHTFVDLTGTA